MSDALRGFAKGELLGGDFLVFSTAQNWDFIRKIMEHLSETIFFRISGGTGLEMWFFFVLDWGPSNRFIGFFRQARYGFLGLLPISAYFSHKCPSPGWLISRKGLQQTICGT